MQSSTSQTGKYSTGFSLIELMVTLSVASIVMMVAIPSFQSTVSDNQMATAVNEFVRTLNAARSEALKQSIRVTVCKSNNPTVAEPACTTSGGWEQGWIAFVDKDADSVVDYSADLTVDEMPFQIHAPLEGSNRTLRGQFGSVTDRVTFLASGYATATNGQLILCDDRIKVFATDKGKARVVIISQIGRIRTVEGDHADVNAAVNSCT
ncbi:MAG: GspH/FimT family pseudopilin [Gammaproteobacteria bacterium]|nr:GspH/FimT family pseudopilin [Gammaproteobacteria bacterium]